MKAREEQPPLILAKAISEILILSDGKVFAHNITPEMARLLLELNPADEAMSRRGTPGRHSARPAFSKLSRSRGDEAQINGKSETPHVVSYTSNKP